MSRALVLLLLAIPAAAAPSREAVREAASRSYVHGMTAEIAAADFGVDAVPALLGLLRDPTFSRRDNVVAILGFLGGAETTSELVEFVPTTSAADDRAALLAPEALGRIAGRGESRAGMALVAMQGRARGAMLSQVKRGLRFAFKDPTLEGDPVPQLDGAGVPQPSGGVDVEHQEVRRSLLSYVNHVNVTSPLTDALVDERMTAASLKLTRDDFTEDIACCATMARSGMGRSWGSANDGLDTIDSNEDLTAVLNDPIARVKVVRVISWCGSTGSNILGCAWIGGKGMAVVRVGDAQVEAALWAHEWGHNTGLNHNSDNRYLMHGTITQANVAVNQTECNSYHSPTSGTSPVTEGAGPCGSATPTPTPVATPTPTPTPRPPCVLKGGSCSSASQCCSRKCSGKRCR